jgi:DNA-binding YbaB/EbfC family protein|tara:strand:- start:62 stop:421 length:360 start_codon:yes stop_codon:yes gene_type:complete
VSRKTNKQKNLPKGGGGIKDKFKQIQQLQQMQAEMKKTRSALAKEVVTVVSADGRVTIEITGDQRVKNILISKELLINGDAESVGDLLVTSVNEAIQQSQSMAASRLEKLTAGLGLGLS